MISVKKPQKMRVRGTEILMNFMQGLLKLRQRRTNLNNLEKKALTKFFSVAMSMCQDNQWVLRKICAEKLEDLALLFSDDEIQTSFLKEVTFKN